MARARRCWWLWKSSSADQGSPGKARAASCRSADSSAVISRKMAARLAGSSGSAGATPGAVAARATAISTSAAVTNPPRGMPGDDITRSGAARPDRGGDVPLAGVGQDRDHRLARPQRAGHVQRHTNGGARRDADEQPFPARQLEPGGLGLFFAYPAHLGQQRAVENLGDEAGADALNAVGPD